MGLSIDQYRARIGTHVQLCTNEKLSDLHKE
jgi:hypothetical protein